MLKWTTLVQEDSIATLYTFTELLGVLSYQFTMMYSNEIQEYREEFKSEIEMAQQTILLLFEKDSYSFLPIIPLFFIKLVTKDSVLDRVLLARVARVILLSSHKCELISSLLYLGNVDYEFIKRLFFQL